MALKRFLAGLPLSFCLTLLDDSPSFSTEKSISELLEKEEAPPPISEAFVEDDLSAQGPYIQTSSITLSVLDKITARVSEVRGNVGQKITFGNLEVMPQVCYKAPADEKPESAARLTIYDVPKEQVVFSGWMFASSPALSTLEHPTYDIWVKECTGIERSPAVLMK